MERTAGFVSGGSFFSVPHHLVRRGFFYRPTGLDAGGELLACWSEHGSALVVQLQACCELLPLRREEATDQSGVALFDESPHLRLGQRLSADLLPNDEVATLPKAITAIATPARPSPLALIGVNV